MSYHHSRATSGDAFINGEVRFTGVWDRFHAGLVDYVLDDDVSLSDDEVDVGPVGALGSGGHR